MSQSRIGTLTIEPITNEETNRPANYTQEDLRLSLLHSGVCATNKSNTIIMKLTDEPIRFWNSATVILWYVLAGSSNSSWGTWIYKYRTMQTGQGTELNRSIRNKKQPSLYLSICLSLFSSLSSLSLSLSGSVSLSLSFSLYISHTHTHTFASWDSRLYMAVMPFKTVELSPPSNSPIRTPKSRNPCLIFL